MVWFHDLNTDVQNAIKWFAAEYKYLKELRDDLERIKRDTSASGQEKDYRNVRRAWVYVRRCERRAERNLERVIKEIKQTILTNPSIADLEKQIEISSEKLLKAFSFYAGDFKKKLDFIAVQFGTEKRFFGKKAEQAASNIKITAFQIEQYVDTLIVWVSGLEASLNHLDAQKEEVNVESKEGLKNKIAFVESSNRLLIRLCSRVELFNTLMTDILEERQIISYHGNFNELIKDGNVTMPHMHFNVPWRFFANRASQWNYSSTGLGYMEKIYEDISTIRKKHGNDTSAFFQELQEELRHSWWSAVKGIRFLGENIKSPKEKVAHLIEIFTSNNISLENYYPPKEIVFILDILKELKKNFSRDDLIILANFLGDPQFLSKNRKYLRKLIELVVRLNNIYLNEFSGVQGRGSGYNEKTFQGYEAILIYHPTLPCEKEIGEISRLIHWSAITRPNLEAEKYLIGVIVIIPLRNFVEDIINFIKSDKCKFKIPVYDSRGILRYPV
jgi:phosphoribosylformylglycinamidine (FGAM) synthase PurS component